jgi:hypothetical protein
LKFRKESINISSLISTPIQLMFALESINYTIS